MKEIYGGFEGLWEIRLATPLPECCTIGLSISCEEPLQSIARTARIDRTVLISR